MLRSFDSLLVVCLFVVTGSAAWATPIYTLTDLGALPGGKLSQAASVNNSGQVVGNSSGPGQFANGRAVLWDAGGIHDLGLLLGYNEGWASDINDAGHVVGTDAINGGSLHGFLWDGENLYDIGSLVDLNSVVVNSDGWTLDSASSISDTGYITGYGTVNGETRAFLLTPVPEPGTWALMSIGLAGFALFQRKRHPQS